MEYVVFRHRLLSFSTECSRFIYAVACVDTKLFFFFFIKILFILWEWGREGEREGEKHTWLPLICTLSGTEPATQSCAWLGIEPATFWFTDHAPTNWATLARAGHHSFWAWIIFCFVAIPHFDYLFISWWALEFPPFFDYYKYAAFECFFLQIFAWTYFYFYCVCMRMGFLVFIVTIFALWGTARLFPEVAVPFSEYIPISTMGEGTDFSIILPTVVGISFVWVPSWWGWSGISL